MNLDWLAGFFDGEGGFFVQPSGYTVRVTLTNTNKASLELVWQSFPEGKWEDKYVQEGKKQGYQLRWDGKHAIPLLEALKERCFINKVRIQLALRLIHLCEQSHDYIVDNPEKLQLASELTALGKNTAKSSFSERRAQYKKNQRLYDLAKKLGVSHKDPDVVKAFEMLWAGKEGTNAKSGA